MKNPSILGIIALSTALLPSCKPEASSKPNIILIMSDDQGWGDTELSGNSVIDTPNLNKIATNGVQFERFYVNPMCAPTRASLLTGRYNLRAGTSWVGRRTDFLGLDETTLADILRKEGYATGCYGKWHLGAYGPYHPNERGFDDFTGFLLGACNHYFETHMDNNGKEFISNSYITDLLTDSALNFIDKNKDQPFFCYIPYNVPHHPFQVPDKYFKKYKARGVEDDRTASVYAMIDNMDENIGRIMKKLEEEKLDENTILIFLSDNGPCFERYNDGLAGIKAQVSEGSVRVPCYISWKGTLPEGKRVFDIAAHIDILPTLLAAANIQIPEKPGIDGINLLPYLTGEKNDYPDRKLYAHQTYFGDCSVFPGGLRTQQYRLVNWQNGYELFDMWNDPSQKRNIANEKIELLNELIEAYESWYSEVTEGGVELPPVPVGYPGYDVVNIITPDALKSDGIDYSGKWGWATGWLRHWTDTKDSITWQIDVIEPGNYEFILHYWCETENTGTEFVLSNGESSLNATLTVPNEGDFLYLPSQTPIDSPDIRDWAPLNMGTMILEKGPQDLVLKALSIPGEHAGEFRSLEIIKKS
jgi:arylsulfatase A